MPDGKDASAPAPVRGLVRRAASTDAFRTGRFPAGSALERWVDHLWTVDRDLGNAEPVESRVISIPALHPTAEGGNPGEVRHGRGLPATLVHAALDDRAPQARAVAFAEALAAHRPDAFGEDPGARPGPRLADLAVRLGWSDRAHLTNEPRWMLGETPARCAARARERAR